MTLAIISLTIKSKLELYLHIKAICTVKQLERSWRPIF